MSEHMHTGPNDRRVTHNHQHGDVSHMHGSLQPMERWTWSRVAADYVVTFDPRPVSGPGALKGLRPMTLGEARDVLARGARIPKTGRIVHVRTLEIVA